jgi:hypothetical protein
MWSCKPTICWYFGAWSGLIGNQNTEVRSQVHHLDATRDWSLPISIAYVSSKQPKGNKDSSYLTFKSSVILKDNHTEDDICLDQLVNAWTKSNSVWISRHCNDGQEPMAYTWTELKPGNQGWLWQRCKAFAGMTKTQRELWNSLTQEGERILT